MSVNDELSEQAINAGIIAGGTFFATLTVSIAQGVALEQALIIASLAAGGAFFSALMSMRGLGHRVARALKLSR